MTNQQRENLRKGIEQLDADQLIRLEQEIQYEGGIVDEDYIYTMDMLEDYLSGTSPLEAFKDALFARSGDTGNKFDLNAAYFYLHNDRLISLNHEQAADRCALISDQMEDYILDNEDNLPSNIQGILEDAELIGGDE